MPGVREVVRDGDRLFALFQRLRFETTVQRIRKRHSDYAFQMLRGEPITVMDDGEQTRDFVNVHDVAQANIKAALASGVSGAFNIGSGKRISINALLDLLSTASGIRPTARYDAPRPGDVRHSLADISTGRSTFGFDPNVGLVDGLTEYMEWVKKEVQR